MSAVTAQIVLRFVGAAATGQARRELLASVGVPEDLDRARALRQMVPLDAYYDVLERAGGADHGLPVRYGESVQPDDFGAMGLALKTAADLREALERVARYVLVLTDSLDYELRAADAGAVFVMRGRPPYRPGARLANEGALAAIVSLLRSVATAPVTPLAVSFRHAAPGDTAAQGAFFACPLRFGAPADALLFDDATLATPTRLADEGLSAFLLAQLEELRERSVDRSLEARVRRAVTDTLCDGAPSRPLVARRLGMGERTLQRRLADAGVSFRSVAEAARREVAESLLREGDHSLAEVAFLCGFSEQSAFQRAFKRWSGQTPLEFRDATES